MRAQGPCMGDSGLNAPLHPQDCEGNGGAAAWEGAGVATDTPILSRVIPGLAQSVEEGRL